MCENGGLLLSELRPVVLLLKRCLSLLQKPLSLDKLFLSLQQLMSFQSELVLSVFHFSVLMLDFLLSQSNIDHGNCQKFSN